MINEDSSSLLFDELKSYFRDLMQEQSAGFNKRLDGIESSVKDMQQNLANNNAEMEKLNRKIDDNQTWNETRFAYFGMTADAGIAYKTQQKVQPGQGLLESRDSWRKPKPFDR